MRNAYINLKAEMKRRGIKVADVAELIGKRDVSVSKNLNGTGGDFKAQEVLKIHKVFFPKLDIEYLFWKG